MMLASRLGWPSREWGLDNMDAIEFSDWIMYFTTDPTEWKPDEQVFAEQMQSFAALKDATKK